MGVMNRVVENGLRIALALGLVGGVGACGGKRGQVEATPDTQNNVVPSGTPESGPTITWTVRTPLTGDGERVETNEPTMPPEPSDTPWPVATNGPTETMTPGPASPTPELMEPQAVNSYGLEIVPARMPELKETATKLYEDWKVRYVSNGVAGEGRLRVVDDQAESRTRSEGVAYGMLLAVGQGDQETFEGLWLYAQDHFNNLGLMDWDIGASGEVVGEGSATDADLDMAYALLLANQKWGGYETEIGALLDAIWENDVEKGSLVLKPGGHWGGSEVTNPSYFALGYMGAFSKADPEHDWPGVKGKMIEILRLIEDKAGNKVFVPDWSNAQGDPVVDMSYDHTYDATRIGWRMAQAAIVEPEGAGAQRAAAIADHFRYNPPNTIFDGYDLTGKPVGQWHNNAFVAPVWAAMAVLDNPRAGEYLDEVTRLMGDRYYQDSLAVLAVALVTSEQTK